MTRPKSLLQDLQADIPASLVVFLVALPLCLGIALASGAPLISGLIAGIVGGIVVGVLSGSQIGVSGPAAGLAVIVLVAIGELGGFANFLVAVSLAGVIQLGLGFARAGIIGYYFPSSVIRGMLSGIGVIIILKQIPHAFGYDADPVGDLEYNQPDGETTFSELGHMIDSISMGPVLVTVAALSILLLWESKWFKSKKIFSIIPGPLVAVIAGVFLNLFFKGNADLAISTEHLVSIPIATDDKSLIDFLTFPNFSALSNFAVYKVAIVLAIVGSLETLLSVEASDKLDPQKRITPTNRELKAQGVGNIVSGLIGGLPITQVIVRSSANAQSGGRTKISAILHGFLLVTSVLLLPAVMNLIPLATLAAILFVVGYKLAKPSVFASMYRQGLGQFIPFIVTIIGIVYTDLLIGIGLGVHVAVLVVLFENFKLPFTVKSHAQAEGETARIVLAQQVTFLNKASVLKTLDSIPENSSVVIDATNTVYIHPDVVEIIEDFMVSATNKDIQVSVLGMDTEKQHGGSEGLSLDVTLPQGAGTPAS